MAMSMILTIFAALASESEPPKTVKSCAKTKTTRPCDAAVAGDEAVAGDALRVHAKIGGAVGDELVGLFEGALVEQEVDALARGELAGLALSRARRSAPPPSSAMAVAGGQLGELGLVTVRLGAGRAGCSAAAIGSDFSA